MDARAQEATLNNVLPTPSMLPDAVPQARAVPLRNSQSNRPDIDTPRLGLVGSPRAGSGLNDFIRGAHRARR